MCTVPHFSSITVLSGSVVAHSDDIRILVQGWVYVAELVTPPEARGPEVLVVGVVGVVGGPVARLGHAALGRWRWWGCVARRPAVRLRRCAARGGVAVVGGVSVPLLGQVLLVDAVGRQMLRHVHLLAHGPGFDLEEVVAEFGGDVRGQDGRRTLSLALSGY